MTKVAFLGMTHLGLVSAVAAAAKGASVVGYDPDPALIARLSRGDLPVSEPGLQERLDLAFGRIAFSADSASIRTADLCYVAPDIATDDVGQSDLAAVRQLLRLALGESRPDAAVIVLSQVPPGFTRAEAGRGRQVFYQVETLIFGRAVQRAMEPERIIVGCADPAQALPKHYADFLGRFACPVFPMRYESAELAKISINLVLVGAVTVANTLAELCEAIGADWGEIVPALRLDRRIGAHAYLAAGLGLSGGNLERDLATVERLADEFGTDGSLVRTWFASSARRKDWVFRILSRRLLASKPGATIGVLGLAYKENTHSTKNSPALMLLAHRELVHVKVFDPVVPASTVPRAVASVDALDAAADADAVAVMTPWPQFRALSVDGLARAMKGRLLVDPYGLYDASETAAAGLEHHVLGRAPAAERR